MPNQTRIEQEFEAIKNALEPFPDGAAIEDIVSHEDVNIPRRTLHRRLLKLAENRQIEITGKGRGTRYHLLGSRSEEATQSIDESMIPLSPAGKDIMRLLSRPLSFRQPVSYRREFLDNYQPGKTAYLSASERGRLWEIGKTSAPERPAGTYAKEILSL